MNARPAPRDVETCEIGWWRGYVKGRFQAYLVSPDGSRLIGESPSIPWRSSTAPGPTEAAIRALGVLTEVLVAQGWNVTDATVDPWFRLTLARPATEGRVSAEEDAPATAEPPTAARKRRRPRQRRPADVAVDVAVLDEALLEQLRAELEGAREEAQRERDRRLEAENKALRLVEPVDARPRGAQHPPTPVLLAVYAIAVVAAALVGLVGFESGYGAAVAALTVFALSIAIDSWIAARRRTALRH